MKKLFLIPLMAMLCTVMACGATVQVSDFAELKAAIAAADPGDEIQLTADIAYPKNGEDLINITKSLTLDGQGHKISGYGSRGGQPNVIAINYNNSSYVTVELKNLDIYSTQYRPVETRGYITKLTLDNVNITSTGGSSNPQGLTIGGYQTSEPYAQLVIKNSKINATASGYPVIFWNPTIVTATNSDFSGYCALYFKTDSKHSVVNADACNFDAPNVHSGASNAFAVFALEDGDMTFNLNNCGMNAEQFGDQHQSLFSLSEWTLDKNRGIGAINITLSGDNSHFNSNANILDNGYVFPNPDGNPQYGPASDGYLVPMTESDAIHMNVSFTITGGTYSVNPKNLFFKNDYYLTKDEEEWVEHYNSVPFAIPEGYEVSEVQQGDITLYRVVKKAAAYVDPVTEEVTLYDLNDAVETIAEGENPVTSFELSTGGTMELDEEREVTTAGYVQVKDNEDTGIATVVKVGTTDGEENKVDQTLVINNGLDVQGDSKVEVQAGSALVIGEGGINTEKPENIVIEADENGAATLLLDPTITVNQTPELTVKMMAKQVGYKPKTSDPSKNDYYWHRFAMPVDQITELPRTPYVGTSIKFWDYTIGAEGAWADIPALTAMTPFNGYTLCPASAPQDVEYTFKGKLVGNTNNPLNFSTRGFNFFGNSYTGYISLLQLVDLITGDAKLEGSVWVWTPYQTYEGISLTTLRVNPTFYDEDWMKEVAPMQTFVLLVKSDDMPDMEINYASAVWGNPRYDDILRPDATPTPRRAASTTPAMRIEISAANGKTDAVMFFESENLSDAFDNGHDVSKYMNEGSINAYSTIDRDNFSTVATNNLEGKTISLNTNDEIAYTLLFKRVIGEDYALEDMATGKVIAIKEGATYEFAAQPNSTVADRFRIVGAHKVPTSVETTEAQNVAKGIYTILGQYVGEDFHALPAGVYVVDGVKIIK